jgi:hypothetical protein
MNIDFEKKIETFVKTNFMSNYDFINNLINIIETFLDYCTKNEIIQQAKLIVSIDGSANKPDIKKIIKKTSFDFDDTLKLLISSIAYYKNINLYNDKLKIITNYFNKIEKDNKNKGYIYFLSSLMYNINLLMERGNKKIGTLLLNFNQPGGFHLGIPGSLLLKKGDLPNTENKKQPYKYNLLKKLFYLHGLLLNRWLSPEDILIGIFILNNYFNIDEKTHKLVFNNKFNEVNFRNNNIKTQKIIIKNENNIVNNSILKKEGKSIERNFWIKVDKTSNKTIKFKKAIIKYSKNELKKNLEKELNTIIEQYAEQIMKTSFNNINEKEKDNIKYEIINKMKRNNLNMSNETQKNNFIKTMKNEKVRYLNKMLKNYYGNIPKSNYEYIYYILNIIEYILINSDDKYLCKYLEEEIYIIGAGTNQKVVYNICDLERTQKGVKAKKAPIIIEKLNEKCLYIKDTLYFLISSIAYYNNISLTNDKLESLVEIIYHIIYDIYNQYEAYPKFLTYLMNNINILMVAGRKIGEKREGNNKEYKENNKSTIYFSKYKDNKIYGQIGLSGSSIFTTSPRPDKKNVLKNLFFLHGFLLDRWLTEDDILLGIKMLNDVYNIKNITPNEESRKNRKKAFENNYKNGTINNKKIETILRVEKIKTLQIKPEKFTNLFKTIKLNNINRNSETKSIERNFWSKINDNQKFQFKNEEKSKES